MTGYSNFVDFLSSSMQMWPVKDKDKVVPVLPLTEHHVMKTYWGSGGTAPHII
jgi:hypothetical protein